ncbi:MAG: UvrD-helicase domain-containing protein, partial [Planctomycetes bacterium]|nr:UvrD-helicase domain-containing protein [Planctomycetota bacterium]
MSEVRYPKPAVLGALRGEGAAPPRLAVIEASAGTGKTFTIEHAVVELVLAGTPIEQLLVVTFTERATSELRERVRALLERVAACRETPPGTGAGRDAWVLDDAARARLQAALLAFDQAPISTIHGFCQRTLVENAFLLGRLLHQELEDERSAFSRAFKHCLRRQLATGALESELVAWLGKGRTVDALETLLYSVHGKRAEVRPPLDPRRLQRALDEALAWASDARLGQARAQVADPARRLHGRTRAAILARLDKLEAWADASDEPPTLLELHADERVDSALDYLLKPTPSAALEALGGEAQALVTCLRSLRAAMTTFEAAATQLFLPPVQRRLAEVKLREGVYTFGDMLAVVREALAARDADGAPTPQGALLLRRLRARYRHALIDEFQDTDEVQWGIFRRVFLESPEHGLWVVGDPKQAIYGFRGGDVFTYLRARAELTHAQAARQPLRASYRSTPALIAALHALYDPQAPAPFFRHPEIPYDDQVRCGVPGRRLVGRDGAPAAPIKVCKLVVPEGQTLSAGRIRERHGRWIAREVRDLLAGGLRYGAAGEERPIPAHEVFCLTRTRRE